METLVTLLIVGLIIISALLVSIRWRNKSRHYSRVNSNLTGSPWIYTDSANNCGGDNNDSCGD